jgi:hypothetical protein
MILILDTFFTGSHRYWGEQLKKRLPFPVQLITLSGKHWKWRMEGGAYELAQKFKKLSQKPKIIIATDMVNIPLFYAFANISKDEIPCILYFHENQFAYPINKLYTQKKIKEIIIIVLSTLPLPYFQITLCLIQNSIEDRSLMAFLI